ncbi:MAG: FAD-dependent oxidoreductase [Cyanobacteria bacterium J06627_28]
MWDVAIMGAGLAGLTCAQQLREAGYQVCVLDKSRGLGGRMATRRVNRPKDQTVRVDHGLPYWQPVSDGLRSLTDSLLAAGVIKPWAVSAYDLRQDGTLALLPVAPPYVAPSGMSAIAKHLAQNLTPDDNLLTAHRATALTPQDGGWRINCDEGKVVLAKQCAIAIPAPQALDLLTTAPAGQIDTSAKDALQAVQYDACLSVLAGYAQPQSIGSLNTSSLNPDGWMVTDTVGTSTAWVGLDSSKRNHSKETVVVIHSKPGFAERYLAAGDVQPAASVLLRANARKFGDWIAQPDWFQIQRWRYANVAVPYSGEALTASDSLVCGGDWCVPEGEMLTGIDAAYLSGQAMARAIQSR